MHKGSERGGGVVTYARKEGELVTAEHSIVVQLAKRVRVGEF